MIVFLWCVRAQAARQRMLITGLIIFLLLVSFSSEQISLTKFAVGMAVDASREEAEMPRKLNRNSRQRARDKFHFERLEPREMFSASGGLTLEEMLALRQHVLVEHQVETPETTDTAPPVGGQTDVALDNLARPIVLVTGDATTQTSTPLQLSSKVQVTVYSNVDMTVQWSKISGPGTATFSDGSKLDSNVQFDQPGTYVLKLEATNKGLSGSGFVTVTVDGTLATDPIAPELFDTAYALPTGGTTYNPINGTEFQAALNLAQPGDVIVLQAGTTYTGSFYLPNKGAGTDWIYIISSDLASLPEGERVSMSDASHMPKLVSSNYQIPPLRTTFGAHHYRIVGIEIPTVPGYDILTNFAINYDIPEGGTIWDLWDNPADTAEEQAHHITVDRCLIYSNDDAKKLRHGIMLNGEYMAVVDSYIANVKDGADAQAIWIYNGNGPYKIVNNFLEATGENFMAGGTDPKISNCVPSDIEFRNNYLFKRLDWKTNPTPNWTIKNLFELKNAQRVLVSGNVMENNWADGQAGCAVVFTVRNQNGTASWSVVQDINFESNIVKNTGQAITITGEDDEATSQQTKRIRVHNNIFENVTRDYSLGPFLLGLGTPNRPILYLTVTHNTFLSSLSENGPTNHISLGSDRTTVDGFILKDNIMVHGTYPPVWSRIANKDVSNNVLIMLPGNPQYASNKSYFSTQNPGFSMADPGFGAVGFVDYLNGNFALSANSPYRNAASNGGTVGANMGVLQQLFDSVTAMLGTIDSQTELAAIPPWTFYPLAVPSLGEEQSEFIPEHPLLWQLDASTESDIYDRAYDCLENSTAQTLESDFSLPGATAAQGHGAEQDELFAFLEFRSSLRGRSNIL